ncbi:hypothetical protein Dda_8364 [Drechslerella dactyloides]|uniref:Uncharacterized protein n=1 Tax=Drechslerella dactyloides TaxID=74499 RepID=A0AAD6IQI8_DREDA|nr:hypothetical protein Dda_8364 [Drechslerella dactyloides]
MAVFWNALKLIDAGRLLAARKHRRVDSKLNKQPQQQYSLQTIMVEKIVVRWKQSFTPAKRYA